MSRYKCTGEDWRDETGLVGVGDIIFSLKNVSSSNMQAWVIFKIFQPAQETVNIQSCLKMLLRSLKLYTL